MKPPQAPTTDDPRERSEWQFEIERLLNGVRDIAKLSQTISNPPTQAEVQAISTKVDAILDLFR